MADVVQLSDYRNPGNGAREAVIKYFGRELKFPATDLLMADHLLAFLWAEGFKVVPAEGKEGEG